MRVVESGQMSAVVNVLYEAVPIAALRDVPRSTEVPILVPRGVLFVHVLRLLNLFSRQCAPRWFRVAPIAINCATPRSTRKPSANKPSPGGHVPCFARIAKARKAPLIIDAPHSGPQTFRGGWTHALVCAKNERSCSTSRVSMRRTRIPHAGGHPQISAARAGGGGGGGANPPWLINGRNSGGLT